MTNPRAAVLVSTARTPVGKIGGALSHLSALELGAAAVSAALSRTPDVQPDHIFMGNVVQAGNGQNPARAAAIKGGVSPTVPGTTINDVCLASITATGLAASLIRASEIDTALVGGFESMSQAPFSAAIRGRVGVGDRPLIDLLVRDGLWCAIADSGMGEMSDAANRQLGVSRAEQDDFAYRSHARADTATRSGRLKHEIDALTDVSETDEGIRPETTVQRLNQLRPAFTAEGTITAGNASQMSDAAAAGMVMARAKADALGLASMVEIVARSTVAGPDPSLHLKPAWAAQKLLAGRGMSPSDIALWEINEAFAGVVVASANAMKIDLAAVNVNGGAIALGHPLGASGFRLVMTLAHEMQLRDVEYGIAAICGGGGQGQAMLLRNCR